jgi:hypothetical protein
MYNFFGEEAARNNEHNFFFLPSKTNLVIYVERAPSLFMQPTRVLLGPFTLVSSIAARMRYTLQ